MASAKQSAQQLLDGLPNDASWAEVMYVLYLQQKIERGQQAVAEGRTVSHDEVRLLLE